MKITANTPYQIKYFSKSKTNDVINKKDDKFVLIDVLSSLSITYEEYDKYKDEIFIENQLGKISLDQYVKNEIEKYKESVKEANEKTESFVITHVFAKNDYDSENDFFLSDEEAIKNIKEKEDFLGFYDIQEKTNDETFFIGRREVQLDEKVKQIIWKYILVDVDNKTLLVLFYNSEYDNVINELKEIGEYNILEEEVIEPENLDVKKKFDELCYKYPVSTIHQLQTLKYSKNKLFEFDENLNIFMNPKLSDLQEAEYKPNEFEKIDGKWQRVGQLKKETNTEVAKEGGVDWDVEEYGKPIDFSVDDVMNKLKEVTDK